MKIDYIPTSKIERASKLVTSAKIGVNYKYYGGKNGQFKN
jgi:hypothetical protein